MSRSDACKQDELIGPPAKSAPARLLSVTSHPLRDSRGSAHSSAVHPSTAGGQQGGVAHLNQCPQKQQAEEELKE